MIDQEIRNSINKLMKRFAVKSIKYYQDNYTKEQKNDKKPEPWKPRSKKSRSKNDKKFGSIKRPILFDTGELKKGFRYRVINNGFRIYNNVEHGQYHNEGTSKLPKREFLYESENLIKEMEKEITKEFSEKISKMFK